MCSRAQYSDWIYMGGTGPCGTMRITFGSVIWSWYTSLNIKFAANRLFYVPKTPVYRFYYYGRYGPCGPMRIIFGSVIQSWYISLNVKFGVNRKFHVTRSQYMNLTYIGGTRSCRPIQPIFNTDGPMANRSLFAVQLFAFGRNLGSQSNIFMRPTRIDKINIPMKGI